MARWCACIFPSLLSHAETTHSLAKSRKKYGFTNEVCVASVVFLILQNQQSWISAIPIHVTMALLVKKLIMDSVANAP